MSEGPSISRLDLNLLVALDALLTERSVTKAAQRLQLSQPALSASLARLRTHFGDPILARRGNTYELTPLALRLAEHTAAALESARRVFESQAEWAPETATREFLIYGSDYAFATVGRAAAALAHERAPGVRFRFMLHTTSIIDEAEQRLRSVDGLLIPHGFTPGLHHEDLWHDRWVIVGSSGRPGDPLSMQDLADAPWVFTYQSRTAFTSAGRQLEELGIDPHVDIVAESFLALPHFIIGTDRLGLVQARLADIVISLGGLQVFDPPFDATPLTNALWWHPVHDHDPEHAWMRELFAEAGRSLDA